MELTEEQKLNYSLRRYKISVVMCFTPNIYHLTFPLTNTKSKNWLNDFIEYCWDLMVSPKQCADKISKDKRIKEIDHTPLSLFDNCIKVLRIG